MRTLLPPCSGGADVDELPKVTCGRITRCAAQCLRSLMSSAVYLTACNCGQGEMLSGEWSPSRLSYQSPALPAAVPSACHFRNRSPIGPFVVVIGFSGSCAKIGKARMASAKVKSSRRMVGDSVAGRIDLDCFFVV